MRANLPRALMPSRFCAGNAGNVAFRRANHTAVIFCLLPSGMLQQSLAGNTSTVKEEKNRFRWPIRSTAAACSRTSSRKHTPSRLAPG